MQEAGQQFDESKWYEFAVVWVGVDEDLHRRLLLLRAFDHVSLLTANANRTKRTSSEVDSACRTLSATSQATIVPKISRSATVRISLMKMSSPRIDLLPR